MMPYLLKFLLITGSVLSCKSFETTPGGVSTTDMLDITFESKATEQDMVTMLSRSSLMGGGIYEAIYLEATMQTPALAYSRLKKEIRRKKLTQEQVKKQVSKILAKHNKKICFDVLVKTNNDQATKPNQWSFVLQQGKSYERLAKVEFREKTPQNVFATTSQKFAHVENDMKWFLETSVCFRKKGKKMDQVFLLIDPLFDDAAEAATLEWKFKKKKKT